jgi:hypothetical protein
MKKFINESDKVQEAYKCGTEIGHCEYIDYLEKELTKEREKTVIDFETILNKIIDNAKEDGMNILFPKIVDTPKGKKQDSEIDIFDHEYVSLKCCNDYYGEVYYPLSNGKYLEVSYTL